MTAASYLKVRAFPCNSHVHYVTIQIFVHCIPTGYAMTRSLVKLTEIGTSWGVPRNLIAEYYTIIASFPIFHKKVIAYSYYMYY